MKSMYSIDKLKLIFKNTSNVPIVLEFEGWDPVPLQPGDKFGPLNMKPLNEWDLGNRNEYDQYFELIKEAVNPKEYDLDFSKRLARITPLYHCENFLNHHFQQTPDKGLFLKHLEFHILLFWRVKGSLVTVPTTRETFIKNWVDNAKKQLENIDFVQGSNPSLGPKTFGEIFEKTNWTNYVDALVKCTPQLLNEEYAFIGNQKTQRGVIGAWFKFLKSKGIIKQSLNRDELAGVLSNEIKNFSISGSSIDNESNLYKTMFENQLLKLIDSIN